MANSPYLIFEGFLSNVEGNLGAVLPPGSTYILKEVIIKNTGAGVNRAQIGTDTLALEPVVDENLPATGTAGNWMSLPFSTVYAAATQFRGVATTNNEVYARISAQRVT